MRATFKHRIVFDLVIDVNGYQCEAHDLLHMLEDVEDGCVVIEDEFFHILRDLGVLDMNGNAAAGIGASIGPNFCNFIRDLSETITTYACVYIH